MSIVSRARDFGANGLVANVCDEDYGPTFGDAIDVVLEACEGFVPPE